MRRRLKPPRQAHPDARAIAHEVLVRVETTDAFADVLLAARLATARLAPADQALVTRLVYGTLAWQGRLDHHLSGLVRGPLAGLDPPVRAALRLGLHQLLFLDRIPAYAAVDASVRLAGRNRGAAGLVNAVLRRAAAAGRTGLPLPDATRDPLERLAVEWSHPHWLVARWAAELGDAELQDILAANNQRGPTAVRVHPGRGTRDVLAAELSAAGIETRPSRWAPDGLVLARGASRLRQLPAWRDGRFAFQGEASQLIAPLLGLTPGARVLDACAAPGGKAAHAATLLGGGGLVVGIEPRPGGIRRISAETARLGITHVATLVADARHPPLRPGFDAVLVDAPCTGLGTLRRHPEVRWRRRPDDVPRLAALQFDLLAGVAPLVRAGGVLVYAVCTLTREENEGVVSRFVDAHPAFAVENVAPHAPTELVTPGGFLRTLPHRHGLDGFFAARLRARS
jgi:16S rRNA (cytosine967-C5)-methyltransferase